jgi:hypothetical protein
MAGEKRGLRNLFGSKIPRFAFRNPHFRFRFSEAFADSSSAMTDY